jgi:FlaA1/EpsC-like NDP-sugar epimerase
VFHGFTHSLNIPDSGFQIFQPNIPSFHYSNLPVFRIPVSRFPNPTFQHSNIPLFRLSAFRFSPTHHSNIPSFQYSGFPHSGFPDSGTVRASIPNKGYVAAAIDKALPYRLWIIVVIHLLLFGLSFGLSWLVLKEVVVAEEAGGKFIASLVAVLLIRMAVFRYHDLYQGMWRYVSFPDLLNIIRATAMGTVLLALLGVFWAPLRLPERILLLDLVFCIVLVGGVRFSVRKIREYGVGMSGTGLKARENLVIVGPLERAQALVKEMLSDANGRYNPLAIVDPTRPAGESVMRVSDLPVYPLDGALFSKSFVGEGTRPGAVVIYWPGAGRRDLDVVVERLEGLQIPFRTLPHTDDLLSGRINVSDIRNVEIDDLLERPPVHLSMDQIKEYLEGKTVMVTGGGGSIGSELCRQVARFSPSRLVVVERSENSLYDLQLEMKRRFPALPLHASISSINDGQGLAALMAEMRVNVVFHAAAYKHVPLMEVAPIESAYNNVLGTHNVVRAAIQSQVDRFVMISTDKAVNPANVMGVTKRIAELVVQSHNGASNTRFMTVRFGNVLGSAGSVIPIFKNQIAMGGPVTVTHPEIERYFMTIPEAVQLILQAGCMGNGGEIFILDMGQPVRILHLAEKLITLSGKRPHDDIEIVFTGIRPGEKMYEELFNGGEEKRKTLHPQIHMAACMAVDRGRLDRNLDEIRQMIVRRDAQALQRKFKEMVSSYQCSTELKAPVPGPIPAEGTVSGKLAIAVH